ncbi:MAG: hypothetical protein MK135_15295, partial [Polyangiaceae bacterium]|nr:hypothetical protein [Polyangiaceae bacterium]
RDIEASASEIPGVFLYNIDDLSEVAHQSFEKRQKEADRAEVLVEDVLEDWKRWASGELATPTIKALRARLRADFEAELLKSRKGRLRTLNEEETAAIEKLIESGINRFLHHPTMKLRQEATRRDGDTLDDMSSVLDELFELSGKSKEEEP